MFDQFDFSILHDPEFKEDSVREEIVAPILKRLGYTASGPNRIIRSRGLTHPFVSIGTQRRKINIIPDYILSVETENAFILDAKAPTELLRNSTNVEQAYSYAIHPDVRVPIYSLCNGHEIVVYHISELEPRFDCQIDSIDEHWDELNAILGPEGIQNPHLRDFLPDFGVRAKMSGAPRDTNWVFMECPLDNFTRVTDSLLTSFARFNDHGTECAISFDIPNTLFEQLLSTCDEHLSAQMRELLSRSPFCIAIGEPIVVNISAALGQPTSGLGTNEQFVPFLVEAFINLFSRKQNVDNKSVNPSGG